MAVVDISEVLLSLGLESPTETERAAAVSAHRAAEAAVERYLKYNPAYALHTEYYPQGEASSLALPGTWEVNDTDAYQRRYSRGQTENLQLRHLPLRSIEDLRVDDDGRSGTKTGSFAVSTQQTEGEDYWPNFDLVDSQGNSVCRDGIVKSAGGWPITPGSVRVNYYAGYTQDELHGVDTVINAWPIAEAVLDEASRRYIRLQSRKPNKLGIRGPLTNENLGDYSYSRDAALYARLVGGLELLPESQEKLADYVNYGLLWT